MCSISLSAQEGRGQDVEPIVKETPSNEPDPILSSESESRNLNKVVPPVVPAKEAVRDSVQVKITKPTSKSVEKDQKGEDPLSFNFLYYIIEKFKLSDIIE
jgi:hypothetical protein